MVPKIGAAHNKEWPQKYWGNMGRGRRPDGFAMHFYSNGCANTATHFTVDNMRQQFGSFPNIETAIIEQRALLDTLAPPNQRSGPVGLLLDEWGVWDQMDPDEEKKYGRLFQQITIRSAIAAALGLNVIQRQAGKLVMTNIARVVNVLHALLLTDEDKCVRTTTYYVYEFTKAHVGQMSMQTGSGAPGATARVLHDADLNAANTFATPNRVTPKELKVSAQGGTVTAELPPLPGGHDSGEIGVSWAAKPLLRRAMRDTCVCASR